MTDLRPSANTSTFDDTIANLDPNKTELLVQEAIERLDFRQDQTEIINNYFAQPVIACVDILPGTGVDGDRYLLKGEPPVIKIWDDGAFIDQEFPDGAIVTDRKLTFIRSGDQIDIVNRQVIRDREPNECDNLPLGIEWAYDDKVYKLVSLDNFGTTNETIGVVILQAPDVTTNISLINEQWQSFTPSVDGTVIMFRLSGFYGVSVEFDLKFYEGEGITEVEIYSETFVIAASPNQATPIFTLDCPVIVQAGTKYTYSIQQTSTSTNFVTYIYNNTVPEPTRNYLPDEQSSQGDRDLLNQVFIEPGFGANWKDISKDSDRPFTQVLDRLSPSIVLGDTTKWQISPGSGQIADSYTNPLNPVVFKIQLGGTEIYDIPPELNGTVTNVFAYLFNDNGSYAIAYQLTYPLVDELVDKLFLCEIVSGDGVNIDEVRSLFLPDEPYTKQKIENGVVNLDNVYLQPIAGAMQLSFASGRFKYAGRNAVNNPKLPHTLNLSAIAQITYSLADPDGNILLIGETDFDLGRVWDGTVIVTTSADQRATVQMIYQLFNGEYVVTIGAIEYNDINLALREWRNDRLPTPIALRDSYLCGILIARRDASDLTNLNQARFIYE